MQARAGEEFREDLRRPGARNAEARRILTPAELAPLTQLSSWRSSLAIAQTLGLIAAAIALAVLTWPSPWLLVSIVAIGIAQHGLFILAHEAAHYRLFANREANDWVGRALGMSGGLSMCTYRVTHRLHHNNLYTEEDPDTAIHGGYPRGQGYLLNKLARDLVGLNAWKTFAYFFGAPAINADTNREIRPLDDTSPELRAAARADRVWVVAFHAAAPLIALAVGGWHGLLLYAVLWLVPLVTVLQPILRLRAICEHGAAEDLSSPLTAARTNRTTGSAGNLLARVFLFPHHVNYHVEHHLYPAVPHYHLPALHRLLLQKGALQSAEVRDFAETWRRVFAPRRSSRAANA
ncbi:fatty acid desaturase family protein [Ramlibacter humi]|uniref:Fatty acid desaturase n=1 Tax=Ramlibacter humi TaxID=2530451 RepID=A0A4Z0CDE3_9BURK|nr:fatty acid desaturase family protein [Ramlibacter humi]TFZ08219.1 fatty acid desaturase [Ramlibacter humi]